MSPDADFVGVNWGSTNFRAYLFDGGGRLLDDYAAPAGVTRLDRAGMERQIAELAARWPSHGPIYASGMIGSNVGWLEVPYVEAPAGIAELEAAARTVMIGPARVTLMPGIACRRAADGAPDILRGEDIELAGFAAAVDATGYVALPGTHTKWVRLEAGRVGEFSTAMSGEIYDRLTAQGLLASVIDGEASDGDAFDAGLALGQERKLGLGTLLFGVRARVIRGDLPRCDAASFTRGLLIGSEIADALALYPDLAGSRVPLIGPESACRLYTAALRQYGVTGVQVDSAQACVEGYRILHRRHMAASRELH